MKYLLFGTGDYYQRYKKWFDPDDVVALIDNSPDRQHTVIDGIEVYPPEDVCKLRYDFIVILSFYVREMRQQLIDSGVKPECIKHFFDLYKMDIKRKFAIEYFGATEEEIQKKKNDSVLLLSTDLELQGGPATGLIRVAKLLKKNGRSVVFGSMQDGPQKEKVLADCIPVVIDPDLQIRQMADVGWTHGFSKVICNTIGFNVFISKRDTDTPVIWWLHDSAFFYDGVDKELIRNTDFSNVSVYSVGKVPRLAIQEIVPDLRVDELLYGVEDNAGKIVFIVLGYIERRKGQDILLNAICSLDETVRNKAVFYLVGNDTSEMAKEIKTRAVSIPQIVITGRVSDIERDILMKASDVLICPSREDPMPSAVVEAMIMRKMTIVSDATGISDHIEDGVNGMIFKNGDSNVLADKIRYCIANRDKVSEMSERSRRIYEEHFSVNAFEDKILNL